MMMFLVLTEFFHN